MRRILALSLALLSAIITVSCKDVERAPQSREIVSTPQPVAAPPTGASKKDSQRVLLFVVAEAPCTMSGVSGTSLSPLRLLFIGPELPKSSLRKRIPEGLTITPPIEGDWEWTATNELSFRPKTDWPQIQYRVDLPPSLVPAEFAVTVDSIRITPRGSCVNASGVRFPYRITAPKLPTKPTDTQPDQLMIAFDQPLAPPDAIQKPVELGITLSPALSGEWRWISDRVITFTPNAPWDAGTPYLAHFTPQSFAEGAIIPGYDYRFVTPQSSIERARSNFTVTNPGSPSRDKEAKPDPLLVSFADAVAASDLVDRVLTPGSGLSPELTPTIRGEWRWSSDRVLTFKPEEQWAAGQNYTLRFTPAIFGDTAPGKTVERGFTTASLSTAISSSELYIDPSNPKIKRVVATVALSHPLEKDEFEKHISLTLTPRTEKRFPDGSKAKNFQFKVTYDEFGREAYIQSEPVRVPEIDSQMRIAISAGVRSTLGITQRTGNTEATVYVPGVANYFRIESLSVAKVPNRKREIDQVLVVNATAGMTMEALRGKIQAALLPKHYPAPGNASSSEAGGDEKPYQWDNLAEVTEEVLKGAEPVELRPIEPAEDFTKQLSFTFTAPEGRSLLITISGELTSVDEYRLGQEFKQIAAVGTLPKAVKILSEGSLLSLSGEKKLSVMTRDVSNVEIEIARVLPEKIQHIVSQTGGAFQNPWFNYGFSSDDVSERFTEVRNFPPLAPGQANYTAIDFGNLLNARTKIPRGLFLLKIRELSNPTASVQTQGAPENEEEQEEESDGPDENEVEGEEGSGEESYVPDQGPASDQRLVLVTDLGLLVKNNEDGTHDIFVQSLGEGTPVAQATVQVLGRNGLPLFVRTTGSDGHVVFPKLTDFIREREPVAYVAERNGDLSFLPFGRGDRRLNLSRFSIGGLTTQKDAPGVQAYIFSDRGIYRPGDTIHFGAILKPDDWTGDVSGIPLELVFTDPRGIEIRKEKIAFDRSGFEEFTYETLESSPTGTYELSLYVVKDDKRGGRLGQSSVRVEEFLPDRMTISGKLVSHAPDAVSTPLKRGWMNPDKLHAQISLRNLFGTAATDRRVTGRLTLAPTLLSFREYPDFNFADPLKAKSGFEEDLVPVQTNSDGIADLDLELSRFATATYRLNLLVQGFEAEGGRFVATQISSIVSPRSFLVGVNPHGDLNYLRKGASQEVELIAVDRELRKQSVSTLTAKLVELRWLSVLTKQPNGTYAYQSVQKEIPVTERPLTIPESGLFEKLQTTTPGTFAFIIRDSDGLELNRVVYTVVGEADLATKLEGNAELEIKLDRAEYLPGDTIELQIKAPYAGAGLITIEKEKVYGFTWFKSSTTTSVQRITIPKTLEGNGYINVSFVRALNSREVFLSPLSYGIAPFSISKKPRMNTVSLTAPEVVRPGEPMTIKYRADRPARAALFLVDEGILQVARYETPDPLGHFYRKRALEVDTFQILDLLLPEYSIERALSAAGGDQDLLSKHLNPFKRKRALPAVKWFGIVDIGPSEQQVTYTVPEYFNGSLRVMAVAVSDAVIGVAEKKVTARGDFVISPNIPTAVAPGDLFEVSTSVLNNLGEGGSGKKAIVQTSLAVGEGLEVIGPSEVKLEIEEGSEATALFSLKAKDHLGSTSLRFTTRSGDKQASLSSDLSVRPPSPLRTTMQSGASTGGEQEIVLNRRELYPFHEKFGGVVSPIPFGFAAGLMQYLSSYPFGCTEQIASSALPSLILRGRPELGDTPVETPEQRSAYIKKLNATVGATIRTLLSRQNTDGSLASWYPGSSVSDEINNYVALFLIEARERGYPVPQGLLNDLLRYLRAIANKTPKNFHEARAGAVASYLLTRSGVVTTKYLTALRGWFDDYEQNRPKIGSRTARASGAIYESWKKDIAAAFMAASYLLLKEEGEARAIFSGVSLVEAVVPDYTYYYDRFIHGSAYLYLASRHFPETLKALSPQTMLNYLEPVVNGSYSTLSSAYALLALDSYMTSASKTAASTPPIIIGKRSGGEAPLTLTTGEIWSTFNLERDIEKLKVKSEGYLFYQVTQEGYDRAAPTEAEKSGLEVYREFRNADDDEIDEIRLGEKVTVVLRVRALGEKPIPNGVLVDMLPGGFEVEMSPKRFLPSRSAEVSADSGESLNPTAPIWGFGIEGTTFRPEYADVREDRVLLFGTIPNDKTVEFRYRLTPTNKGTFIVPPLYGESMYDRSLHAVYPGSSITVREAEPIAR